MSILVFGREHIVTDVVAAFFSNHGFTETRLEPCVPGQALSQLETLRQREDEIVIMETPWWRRFPGDGWYDFQTLIDTHLAINGRSFHEILKEDIGKNTRKKIHRLERNQPMIRETRDLDDIYQFCHTLLEPSSLRIHGDQANIPSEEELQAMADKLFLFLMEEDGHTIAGELGIYSKRTDNWRMWRVGVNYELLNNSRLRSEYNLHFFINTLKKACNMGVSTISHGLTSPVMTHGNFIYKLRLGGTPVPISHYPRCSIRFFSDDLPAILAEHPLLLIHDNSFVGMMGIHRELPMKTVKDHLNTFFKGHTYKQLQTID